MNISFKAQPDSTRYTFGDVKNDQFFVSSGGTLCQKVNDKLYNRIAEPGGRPEAHRGEMDGGTFIQRILPEVERIEF